MYDGWHSIAATGRAGMVVWCGGGWCVCGLDGDGARVGAVCFCFLFFFGRRGRGRERRTRILGFDPFDAASG